jgi:Phage integrase, N-terminal SAM-like domain
MPNIQNPSSPLTVSPSGKGKKLLEQYSEALRHRHYSLRTEQTYLGWVRQYILYHNKRHPREMGVAEINDFITHLVNEKTVSASTHTAPAVGAGGTRPSALSCCSIAISCIRN